MLYGCKRAMDAATHMYYFGLSSHGSSFCILLEEILRAAKEFLGISFDVDLVLRASREKRGRSHPVCTLPGFFSRYSHSSIGEPWRGQFSAYQLGEHGGDSG